MGESQKHCAKWKKETENGIYYVITHIWHLEKATIVTESRAVVAGCQSWGLDIEWILGEMNIFIF